MRTKLAFYPALVMAAVLCGSSAVAQASIAPSSGHSSRHKLVTPQITLGLDAATYNPGVTATLRVSENINSARTFTVTDSSGAGWTQQSDDGTTVTFTATTTNGDGVVSVTMTRTRDGATASGSASYLVNPTPQITLGLDAATYNPGVTATLRVSENIDVARTFTVGDSSGAGWTQQSDDGTTVTFTATTTNGDGVVSVTMTRTSDGATARGSASYTVSRTLFGTNAQRQAGENLGAAVTRQRTKYGNLGVIRLFYPGLPPSWSTITPATGTTPVAISFKASPQQVLSGDLDAYFTNWFATAPVEQRTFWTYYHEPEDNVEAGSFTAAQYRGAWARLASIANQAAPGGKLRSTLVLMCWTADPHSNRDWTNYYPAGSIALMAWDCYNPGGPTGEYRTPTRLFTNAMTISSSVGLPWAVAELGSFLPAGVDGTERAVWLGQVTDYAAQNGAQFVTYFDADIGVDYRLLDQPSIDAWAARASL